MHRSSRHRNEPRAKSSQCCNQMGAQQVSGAVVQPPEREFQGFSVAQSSSLQGIAGTRDGLDKGDLGSRLKESPAFPIQSDSRSSVPGSTVGAVGISASAAEQHQTTSYVENEDGLLQPKRR